LEFPLGGGGDKLEPMASGKKRRWESTRKVSHFPERTPKPNQTGGKGKKREKGGQMGFRQGVKAIEVKRQKRADVKYRSNVFGITSVREKPMKTKGKGRT